MITDKGKAEGLQGLNIFKITRGNGYLNFFGNSINVVDSGNFSLAVNCKNKLHIFPNQAE